MLGGFLVLEVGFALAADRQPSEGVRDSVLGVSPIGARPLVCLSVEVAVIWVGFRSEESSAGVSMLQIRAAEH